jgi:hypothetical protein
VTDTFLQYGAIGVIAALALVAVRVLFQREVLAHQRALDRADRLEAELRTLNETVQTRALTTLAQASSAITAALRLTGNMVDSGMVTAQEIDPNRRTQSRGIHDNRSRPRY